MNSIFLVHIGNSVEKAFESLDLSRNFCFEELTRSESEEPNYWTSRLEKHDQTILNMAFEKQSKQFFIDHYNRVADKEDRFYIQEIEVHMEEKSNGKQN